MGLAKEVLLKITGQWLFTFHRAVSWKLRSYSFLHKNSSRSHHVHLLYSEITKLSLESREGQYTLACDFQGTLLRSHSLFPFFMLVAFEGGSILRALFLLLSCPVIWVLGHSNHELSLRLMAFITFCGLRSKDMDLVARAVLPKFYLENLHLQAYEIFAASGKRVVITSMPRLMVERFLKEYLDVDQVVASELQVIKGGYFTGLICAESTLAAVKQKTLEDLFGETKADVALVNPFINPHDDLFFSHAKETYIVKKEDPHSSKSLVMPRAKYPKPLIFHDGRLAFLPTPSAMLAFFMWLPLGLTLSILRILLGLIPYKLSGIFGALSGIRFRATGLKNCKSRSHRGVLYVCTHRTLVDPIMLGTALHRPVPAVTYSLSRVSEIISPIRTVRLTRNRERDAATMRRMLRQGDMAVCPEGTTCREPYLLRFSSLFAELADEMVPVALDARMTMLYGTTASGHKWLDPVAFFMNPVPEYRVEILEVVPSDMTCAGGRSASEVANWIQKQLGDALGFCCTAFTRRDKYMMLAGNEGTFPESSQTKHY